MKKTAAAAVHLMPSATGWRVLQGAAVADYASLEEAGAAVPARARLELALPLNAVLLERMTLPALDREELAGMVELQLEKTLPYPVEEAARTFEIVRQTETESTVLSIVAPESSLDLAVRALRERSRVPQRLTLFATAVGRSFPAGEAVFSLWQEQGQTIAAIGENGRLSWAQLLEGSDAEAVRVELSAMLLSAELDGVAVNFSRVLLAPECEDLREVCREIADAPVETLAPLTILPESEVDLLPASWIADSKRAARSEKLRERLTMAAIVYLLLMAGAFVYLALQKRSVQALDVQIAELQPQIVETQARQQTWKMLAPAVDPGRYVMEVLYQVNKNLPSQEVKMTLFESRPDQFMVEGEAPSTTHAIEFAEKLGHVEELKAFKIQAGNPVILPNNHARFKIFGRL